MEAEITVALLSLAGTGLGSIFGILAANRMTNYRIQQLELKVDKHNCLVERMALVEQSQKISVKQINYMMEHMKLGGSE